MNLLYCCTVKFLISFVVDCLSGLLACSKSNSIVMFLIGFVVDC